MRTTFRAAIAFALVGIVLLVKIHLDSISQWQVSSHPRSETRNSYVLENGDAYIEVSADEPSTTPSTTRKKWIPARPTSRPMSATAKLKSIPVRVPGAELAGKQDRISEFFRSQGLPDTRKGKAKQPKPSKNDNAKGAVRPIAPLPRPKITTPKSDRIIVLAKLSYEDTSWLENELPEWQRAVYLADDPHAPLHLEHRNGKQSNPYLQYIVENYDKLPEYMVFLHAHRYSEHIDFPKQDNALNIQILQLNYLKKTGYLNLRCDWSPGCPAGIQPFRQMAGHTAELAFAGAWIGIFNNTDIPKTVATPYGSQFAVTREQVLKRPRRDYQSYQDWYMTTELDDKTRNSVFGYLWHIIFGQDPVFCPEEVQCYRDIYDMDMEYVWLTENSSDDS